MNFEESSEFAKDIKRLSKKWRSIPADIEYVKPRIESLYTERADIDVRKYREEFFAGKTATILATDGESEAVKMRLDVASLSSNSKVRLIFIAIISANKVLLIELYAKNDKENEDTERVKKYL